jgi:c-di-GMP-binding flagellar brake protein YcgR
MQAEMPGKTLPKAQRGAAKMKMRDLLRGSYHSMARFHEQREFQRVKVNTAVSLHYENPEKNVEALCINISESGMGILSDRVVPMGTEYKVKIHDGRNNKSEFQALIEINRIFELEEGQFILGAKILERF